jgi:hypothetical protein
MFTELNNDYGRTPVSGGKIGDKQVLHDLDQFSKLLHGNQASLTLSGCGLNGKDLMRLSKTF